MDVQHACEWAPAATGKKAKSEVHSKHLEKIIALCEDDAIVKMTPGEDGLRLRIGRANILLPYVISEALQIFEDSIASTNERHVCTLSVEAFRDLIHSVEHCAGRNDMRPFIKSVYLHPVDGLLVVAATNGFRLATMSSGIDAAEATLEINDKGVLLPIESVEPLVAILKTQQGDLTISVMGDKKETRRIIFETERFRLVNSLICGSFPAYLELFKGTGSMTTICVNKVEFEKSLSRLEIVTQRYVRMETEGTDLKITSTGGNLSHELVSIDSTEPVSMSLDPALMLETISRMKSTTQRLQLPSGKGNGPEKAIIEGVDADTGWKAMIAGVRQ